MAQVELKSLTKTYPDKAGTLVRAVNGIDLTIRDREFMVLVGPSGCGKSTTLRMIAGLEDISWGTVSIAGRVVNNVHPKDRDIAMVFQNYALYPHMSVYENLSFGLRLRGMPQAEIDARVREAAAMLQIDRLLDRKPKALSGGQRQRVAVGRAIVRMPKVFLFDEPLSNLDAKMRVSTRTEISKLHTRLDATMIYVTHDQTEAMTMGDRICVMRDGNVMQVGTPLEIYHRPANRFVAGFIGSPSMNFFIGHLEAEGERVVFVARNEVAVPVRLTLPPALANAARSHHGEQVVLGIRPEDIALAGDSAPRPGTIEAWIELVEPMGAEAYLYLTTKGTSFVARVPTAHFLEEGCRTRLELTLDRAHLFDASSERRISGA